MAHEWLTRHKADGQKGLWWWISTAVPPQHPRALAHGSRLTLATAIPKCPVTKAPDANTNPLGFLRSMQARRAEETLCKQRRSSVAAHLKRALCIHRISGSKVLFGPVPSPARILQSTHASPQAKRHTPLPQRQVSFCNHWLRESRETRESSSTSHSFLDSERSCDQPGLGRREPS